jgi:hypothetical protein
MSPDTLYEQLRGHLHYLKLAAVAEALAAALEHAERDRPGYTEFLADLLKTEVDATEQRSTRPSSAASKAAYASQSCPPARPWASSTTTRNPHWTAA